MPLLEFFASTHSANVRDAVHGQYPIEMINLMLQQLRQISLFAGLNFVPFAAQVLVFHRDFTMSLHLHENGKETQASIPNYDFFFAALGNLRIYKRPRLGFGELEEN